MSRKNMLLSKIKPEYLGMIEGEREKSPILVEKLLNTLNVTEYVSEISYGDYIELRRLTQEFSLFKIFNEE